MVAEVAGCELTALEGLLLRNAAAEPSGATPRMSSAEAPISPPLFRFLSHPIPAGLGSSPLKA